MMPKYLYTIADDYAPGITTTCNVRFYLMFILSVILILRSQVYGEVFCK